MLGDMKSNYFSVWTGALMMLCEIQKKKRTRAFTTSDIDAFYKDICHCLGIYFDKFESNKKLFFPSLSTYSTIKFDHTWFLNIFSHSLLLTLIFQGLL